MDRDLASCYAKVLESLPKWSTKLEEFNAQMKAWYDQNSVEETDENEEPRRTNSSTESVKPVDSAPLEAVDSLTSRKSLEIREKTRKSTKGFYDADIQRTLEILVKDISASHSVVLKEKMYSQMDKSSLLRPRGSNPMDLRRIRQAPRSTEALRPCIGMPKPDSNVPGVASEQTGPLDKLDVALSKMGDLCERAAYQVLRQGACDNELKGTTLLLLDIKRICADEKSKCNQQTHSPQKMSKRGAESEECYGAVTAKKSRHQSGKVVGLDDSNAGFLSTDVVAPIPSVPITLSLDVDDDSDDDWKEPEMFAQPWMPNRLNPSFVRVMAAH